jgi:hypothetical protein
MVLSVIIGGGIGILMTLAVLIGQAAAQDRAWRAIARERRTLEQRKQELISAAASGHCPCCRLHHADLH